MPQPDRVSSTIMHGERIAEEAFEASNDARSLRRRPTAEILDELQYTDDHLYDVALLRQGRLADKSILLAELVANGETGYLEPLIASVSQTERELSNLTNQFRPHLTWNEDYLQIFVFDKNLTPEKFEKANLDSHQTEYGTEDEVHLEYRQNRRENYLRYTIESIRAAHAVDLLQDFIKDPNDTPSFEALVNGAAVLPESESTPHPSRDDKTAQALSAFEAGTSQTGELRNELFNRALDISTNALETLAETTSTEKAIAYLVAARAVHDLASQPDSFLPHLEEHQARDFRVRALEIAAYWADQSATTFREIFGKPIGKITPESLPTIQRTIALVRANAGHINKALWFENIYKEDYEKAAARLDHQVHNIGQGAVIHALRQPPVIEQTQPQPTVAPEAVAA